MHDVLGVRLADWKIEVLGTDISEKVLMTAQSGKYPHYSIRSVNPMVLNRYFKQDGSLYNLGELTGLPNGAAGLAAE